MFLRRDQVGALKERSGIVLSGVQLTMDLEKDDQLPFTNVKRKKGKGEKDN